MSKLYKDIPADEWERDNCAEEIALERKADKKERGRVSNLALALTSLLEAGGVSRNVFHAVHIFLSKSKNYAPDEAVKFFSERDAGELLPGDEGVAYASLRKRFVRAWGEIEAEQARTGKRFCGRREKGSIRLASRKSEEKKKAAEYFSQIAQVVLDVERAAARLRGFREDRFGRAALEVWSKLPVFTEDDITIFTEDPAASKKGGETATPKQSRRLDRFVRAAKEMLTEAKKRNNCTLEATGRELALELSKVFAEVMDVEPESALRLLADTLTEAAAVHDIDSSLVNTTVQPVYEENEKVRATSQNQNLQNSEQKRENGDSHVYGAVHVEPESDSANCVACGEVIHPGRLEFDAELCDLCGPPRQRGRLSPSPFQLEDEQARRGEGKAEIIYAEDFTV
jgi:hypothetical protein